MTKRLIIVSLALIVIGALASHPVQAQTYWIGNNPNAPATDAELTALGLLTQTEIEVIDGATVSTAELNILDGATTTYNELNMNDASLYFTYFEDFISVSFDTIGGAAFGGGSVSGTNATLSGWNGTGDAGWTLTQAAGTYGGIITATHVTGSNNEFYMQLGELGTETFIEADSGSSKPFWVDFRFSSTDITSSAGNFFVGLAEEGAAAANFIVDAGNDIADVDVLGFVQWEANEDTVQVLWQTSGGAFVDTFSTAITTAQTLWSIYFDGAKTTTFYKDGTSIGSIDFSSTDVLPEGEELSPIIATKGGAQDRVIAVDYIRMIGTR